MKTMKDIYPLDRLPIGTGAAARVLMSADGGSFRENHATRESFSPESLRIALLENLLLPRMRSPLDRTSPYCGQDTVSYRTKGMSHLRDSWRRVPAGMPDPDP